jgi:hypothetical protein
MQYISDFSSKKVIEYLNVALMLLTVLLYN